MIILNIFRCVVLCRIPKKGFIIMKKIISFILALSLLAVCAVSFASCGKEDENVLKMATNAAFPPYEFYDEGEKIVGIDAEIAELIAKDLGMKLEIVDTEFDSIITGVTEGKYDFGMAGMTVTEDRLKSVNFSTSYANGVQVIIVKNDSPITSIDDLSAEGATYKIGVQQGTTGDIYASDTPEKGGFGEERVTSFNTGAEAVLALTTGKVDCVIIDNEPAKSYVKTNEGLKILDTEYVEEDYAICVSKENADLLKKINDSLKKNTDNGEIQKIIDKYIKADSAE